jgi:hypothetical protein
VKLYYLLPVLIVLSCGSRKRELQQTASKFDFKAEIDTSAKIAIKAQSLQNHNESIHKKFLETRINYQGKVGDSMSVKKYGPDGKLESEYKFTGSGTADLSEKESESESNKIIQSSQDTQTNIEASGHKKIAASGSKKAKDLKVERTGVSWITGFQVLIGLLLIILLCRWIKKHVLNQK